MLSGMIMTSDRVCDRGRRQAGYGWQLFEGDLATAASIVGDGEMRSVRREQLKRIGLAATMHFETLVMKGRERTGLEVQATEINNVVFAEEVDLIAEDMAGECRVVDLERRM